MKFKFFCILSLTLFNCAGVTNYYNREGWSYSFTESQFQNRLVVTEKEAVEEKAELTLPQGASIRGKAAVKVLVDPDGTLVAAIVDKNIDGVKDFEKKLIKAAQKTKFFKVKDNRDRPTYYVTIIEYIFR